jgi:hypothetical protein
MKMHHAFGIVALSCGLAAGFVQAAPAIAPGANGTGIIHFFVHDTMANAGVLANASGTVDVDQNQQGNANNRQLKFTLKSLDASTTYQLFARRIDETNLTVVADFTTDAAGAAKLQYQKIGSSNGKGQPKGKLALPDALDPLYEVRELAVVNANTQAVLVADLAAPDKLQYLIKRAMDNVGTDTDASASLLLQATVKRTDLRIQAINLTTNAPYWLALNNWITQTNTADRKGRLKIQTQLANALDVLNLQRIDVLDAATNFVFSTEVP